MFAIIAWGCSKDSEVTPDDNTGVRTFAEAKAKYEKLKEEGFRLPLTRQPNFPQSGTFTYKGMHSGEFFEKETTSSAKIEYYADVELTVDFNKSNIYRENFKLFYQS
ncbi:hypothetical protein BKI52_37325 [marine bacterium AO1-C]|nr:hypothetical protein BKI52_37325 [marine bacterium AO1-C]